MTTPNDEQSAAFGQFVDTLDNVVALYRAASIAMEEARTLGAILADTRLAGRALEMLEAHHQQIISVRNEQHKRRVTDKDAINTKPNGGGVAKPRRTRKRKKK